MEKKALSVDTYDAANYYYGLINVKLGNITDAKDGFDIASQAIEYRSASYIQLTCIYLKQENTERAKYYAQRSADFNRYAIDAYELQALIYRIENDKKAATAVLDTIKLIDPLNHFADAEKFLWDGSQQNAKNVTANIRNETPDQTFLELAAWDYNAGRNADALKVLELAEPNAEVVYWKSYLSGKPLDVNSIKPGLVFPFRPESADVLRNIVKSNDNWLPKYHLALLEWSSNNVDAAKKLLKHVQTRRRTRHFMRHVLNCTRMETGCWQIWRRHASLIPAMA